MIANAEENTFGPDAGKLLRARHEAIHDGSFRSFPSPWPILSNLAMPLLPGTVTVCCGDPGCGKSFMSLQLFYFLLSSAGIMPAMLALEGDHTFHANRLLAQLEGNTGLLKPEYVKSNPIIAADALNRHDDQVTMFGQYLDTANGQAVDYAAIQKWIDMRLEEGRKVLFIDPITHAAPDTMPWAKDKDFVTVAREKMVKANACLWVVSHPKAGMKNGSGWDHIAGGAAWGKFSDCVLWIKRVPEGEEVSVASSFGGTHAVPSNRKIHLVKTRNGSGDGVCIAMELDKRSLTFSEYGMVVES